MEKKFKLPKEFALKWLEALRSGKYRQGIGKLAHKINSDTYGYCCLGVAGFLACGSNDKLLGGEYLRNSKFVDTGLPTELLVPDGDYSLGHTMSGILSQLNDGTANKILLQGLILRKEIIIVDGDITKMDFSQIADFIEDNVEFY